MDLGLRAKACVVTGASRGIGLATARMLCSEGARVVLAARGQEPLTAAVEDCAAVGQEAGGEAHGVALDVTDPAAGEHLVRECGERYGPIEVLVNNAGTSWVRPFEDLTDEDFQRQWDVHVMAPLRLIRAAAPGMAERGSGRIVNVCSSSGKRPSLTNAAYSVSKAAQLSLSRVFADAYAGRGVLVNAVAPGPVETPLWTQSGGLADQMAERQGISRDEVLEATRGKIPLGRFGTEDEVAAVAVFLCSERAGNVSGAAWSVDGGSVPIIL